VAGGMEHTFVFPFFAFIDDQSPRGPNAHCSRPQPLYLFIEKKCNVKTYVYIVEGQRLTEVNELN